MGRVSWIIWEGPVSSQGTLREADRRLTGRPEVGGALRLALKMQNGTTSQGVRGRGARGWKRRENGCAPGASKMKHRQLTP